MLVALREWSDTACLARCLLRVRTDNMATLAMVAKMQPHSARLGIVAREMALDLGRAAYAPQVVVHIPGIANICSDRLLRLHDPEKSAPVPSYLKLVPQQQLQVRDRKWWRASPEATPSSRAVWAGSERTLLP